MKTEYGLSFVDGKRVVRYSSRVEAEAQMAKHPHSKLVWRFISQWQLHPMSVTTHAPGVTVTDY